MEKGYDYDINKGKSPSIMHIYSLLIIHIKYGIKDVKQDTYRILRQDPYSIYIYHTSIRIDFPNRKINKIRI